MIATENDDIAKELLVLPTLACAWRDVELAAEEHLFNRGDPGDAFYMVVAGELEVYSPQEDGGRLVLERLGPGQHLGEVALLDDGARSASVVAVVPSRLRMLRRQDFLAHLSDSPELSALVVPLLGTRLRRTTGYLDYLARWARLVADGHYGQAQDAIRLAAAAAGDADLGRFVTTFTQMVSAVQEREEALRRELRELRIEIDGRAHERKVAEITDSEFFRALQQNAARMRRRLRDPGA